MEKCSLQQSTFLLVGCTDLLVFDFYNPSRKELVHIKYVLIKDSLAVGMRGTYWSNQCMNRVRGSCTWEYMITCWCLSNVYTSLRQASEWGMHGLQGSFSCIKKRLPTHCSQRRLVVESIILIHNFRTEIMGSNQIKTMLDPEYKWYINLEGYDRIRQYYLHPEDFELGVDEDDDDLH